jgi:hypothetical protein
MNAGNRDEITKFLMNPHGKALVEWLEGGMPVISKDQKMTAEAFAIASAEYQGYCRAMKRMFKLTDDIKKSVDKKEYIS